MDVDILRFWHWLGGFVGSQEFWKSLCSGSCDHRKGGEAQHILEWWSARRYRLRSYVLDRQTPPALVVLRAVSVVYLEP